MKRLCVSVLIFMSVISGVYSQDKLISYFEKDLNRYAAAYNERKWDIVTSMLNPGLFSLMPKEDFVAQLASLDEKGVLISIKINSINGISDIVEKDGNKYCLVKYVSVITITLTNKDVNIDDLHKSLVSVYSEDKVKVDKEKRVIATSSEQSMIAASPAKEEKWTYLENTPQGRQLLTRIIPVDVVNKLEGKAAEPVEPEQSADPEKKSSDDVVLEPIEAPAEN